MTDAWRTSPLPAYLGDPRLLQPTVVPRPGGQGWIAAPGAAVAANPYRVPTGQPVPLRIGPAIAPTFAMPSPVPLAPWRPGTGWGFADPAYGGDRQGPRSPGTAGVMYEAGVQVPVDPHSYYPGGVIDAPDGVFIRTNAGGTPIDPHNPTRLMIGVFTTDGRYGQLMPDGTVVPYDEATLTPYAGAMGIPVVHDGMADADGNRIYRYLPNGTNGAYVTNPDGGHMIVLNDADFGYVRDEAMAHEIAHPITEAVAANPAAADAIAALRPELDAMWNNYNTDSVDMFYGGDRGADMTDEEYQRYLDGERLADFFRIYMTDLNIIYDNYRDLWHQIIPIVENLPAVRRYFQFAAADGGTMTG